MDQLSAVSSCQEQNTTCSKRDLCSKRVLIVGGMTKFKLFYRNVIENGGGLFDYHDGYIKQGCQALDQKVGRSDIILRPINCNSHGACLQVKKLCKKHNKPIKMLKGSSVSAISTALFTDMSHDQQNNCVMI